MAAQLNSPKLLRPILTYLRMSGVFGKSPIPTTAFSRPTLSTVRWILSLISVYSESSSAWAGRRGARPRRSAHLIEGQQPKMASGCNDGSVARRPPPGGLVGCNRSGCHFLARCDAKLAGLLGLIGLIGLTGLTGLFGLVAVCCVGPAGPNARAAAWAPGLALPAGRPGLGCRGVEGNERRRAGAALGGRCLP